MEKYTEIKFNRKSAANYILSNWVLDYDEAERKWTS